MKIFTYGALMSTTHLKRVGIDSSSRTPAFLENYKLKFEKAALNDPKKGFANISISEKEQVHGILYDLNDSEILILDARVGGYTRKEVLVKLTNGKSLPATTYVADHNVIFENLLPSSEYIQLICESDDLLPKYYLDAVRTTKTLEDNT